VVLESILVKLGSSGGGGGGGGGDVNKMELLGRDGVQRQERVYLSFLKPGAARYELPILIH
jgi:hypothetical protein